MFNAASGTPHTRVGPVEGFRLALKALDRTEGCGVLVGKQNGDRPRGHRVPHIQEFGSVTASRLLHLQRGRERGHARSQVGAAVASSTTTPSAPGTGTRAYISPCAGDGGALGPPLPRQRTTKDTDHARTPSPDTPPRKRKYGDVIKR